MHALCGESKEYEVLEVATALTVAGRLSTRDTTDSVVEALNSSIRFPLFGSPHRALGAWGEARGSGR